MRHRANLKFAIAPFSLSFCGLMATRQEVFSIEHERPTKPTIDLQATHENTGIHANPHSFIAGESEAFPFWNTQCANANLVKASCIWKPVEDNPKKEQSHARFSRTAETTAQHSRRPMTMHARAHSSEKENVESGSARTRFGLSLSKAEASIAEHKSSAVLFGFTNEKRFQQEGSNKPLKEREVNVLDEAGGGLGVSSGSVTTDYGDGLAAAFLEGSQSHHLKGTPLDYPPEEIGSLKPGCRQILVEQPQMVLVQERLQEASCGAHHHIESYKAPFFSTESMRAPLLRELQDRSEDEIPNDLLRPDDPFLFTQLQNPCEKLRPCFESKVVEIQCVERSPCAEESDYSMPSHSQHIPNTDHVVVLFSVQKCLEDNAARANRYKLLKLSSLCSLYSRKVFGWVTRMVREQNITYCLQRIQQIFSPSAARGFTRLDSQKLPKVSTKMCSPSSKKGLGKDKELRAVLLKINEVLASMETSSSENMQDRNRSETTVSSHG